MTQSLEMDLKSIEEAQTTGLLCISHLKKVYPFHTGPSFMVTDTQ
jgi:hypothetical protein